MAGRLHIAAKGVQDQWLTGEPQFSHFLTQFNRHTKFAIDYTDIQFDNSELDFGKTLNFRIPSDQGDAIRNMTLCVTLGDPSSGYEWIPSVITNMVESAELLIGGQIIEKLTGEYIYMYQQMYNSSDDVEQTVYFLTGHGYQLGYTNEYTYFMDLPFYFYRNSKLSIPTCALTKQIVEVRIKLKNVSELVTGTSPENATATIVNCSIYNEYIFLSEPEKNFLMSRPLDYVITQVQLSSFVMDVGEQTKSVMLNFVHPVKELLFVSQSQGYYTYNRMNNITLKFNGQTVFNEDHNFLGYELFLRHHTNQPVSDYNFYMYSFALKPEVYYPTGHVNMSRISHKLLTVTLAPTAQPVATTTRVYAINYNILRISSGLAGLKF